MIPFSSTDPLLEDIISKYIVLEKHDSGGDIFLVGRCPFHVHDDKGNPFPFYVDPKNQRFRCFKPKCVANTKGLEKTLGTEDFIKLAAQYGLKPLPEPQHAINQRYSKQVTNGKSSDLNSQNHKDSIPSDISEELNDEQENQLFLFDNMETSNMRISFSMLENYQLCPLKYQHIYIYREKLDLVSDNRRIGTSVHNTLKEYYSLPAENRASNKLTELFRKNWSMLQSDNSRWFEEILSMLDSLVREEIHSIPVKLEAGFNHFKDGIILFGRADRIDRFSDGSYEVIDYKVLKHDPKDEFDAANSLQSVFLYYGAYDLLGAFPSKITYLHVQNGKRISFLPIYEDMERKFLEIKRLMEKISQLKDFSATKNQYCPACKLFGKCSATKNDIE